jgi:putative oxidoreductase
MGFTKPQLKNRRQRILVIFIPCILLGLVLLVSGAGKLPGQAEFVDVLLGSFWTPTIAFFISHVLPWIEVILGAVLLLGVFPRIAAVLSLPLIVGFMTNNIWAISQGKTFGSCGCWGIFEELFGGMTPVQALGMDIALLFLALTIIILHPAPFLSFQSWFAKRKGEQNT